MGARWFRSCPANAPVRATPNVAVSSDRMTLNDFTCLCELSCFLFDHLHLINVQQRHVRSQRRGASLKDDEAANDAEDVVQKPVVILQPATVPAANDGKFLPLSDRMLYARTKPAANSKIEAMRERVCSYRCSKLKSFFARDSGFCFCRLFLRFFFL